MIYMMEFVNNRYMRTPPTTLALLDTKVSLPDTQVSLPDLFRQSIATLLQADNWITCIKQVMTPKGMEG